MQNGIELLISGRNGIYVAQKFNELEFPKPKNVFGIDDEQREILASGPEHEQYNDVWWEVLMNFKYIDENKYTWHLWQDDDLWIYCTELMTKEELDHFGFSDDFEFMDYDE